MVVFADSFRNRELLDMRMGVSLHFGFLVGINIKLLRVSGLDWSRVSWLFQSLK